MISLSIPKILNLDFMESFTVTVPSHTPLRAVYYPPGRGLFADVQCTPLQKPPNQTEMSFVAQGNGQLCPLLRVNPITTLRIHYHRWIRHVTQRKDIFHCFSLFFRHQINTRCQNLWQEVVCFCSTSSLDNPSVVWSDSLNLEIES